MRVKSISGQLCGFEEKTKRRTMSVECKSVGENMLKTYTDLVRGVIYINLYSLEDSFIFYINNDNTEFLN